MRRQLALAALAGLLLTGCGLPMPGGVQRPGAVPAEQRLPQPISVLPPGPQPDAEPPAVVLGFLAAQSSARDRHGIARSFLGPDLREAWRDEEGVTVYDPRTVTVAAPSPVGPDEVLVTVTLDAVGEVGADGAARVHPPESRQQRYRLARSGDQWRITSAPDGLSLSPAGRDRSYDPVSVYFLAPLGPRPATRHLVPDLVLLPAEDRAQRIVQRLLEGPSSGLGASAETAVVRGTTLRAPVTSSAAGEITVDLTGPASAMSGDVRADLSAQLVWTLRDALPDFTALRLLVDGAPVVVPGVGEPQPRRAWAGYAPDGQDDRPPGVALVDGRLRSLQPVQTDRDPTVLPDVTGATDVAVDGRRGRLAVLTDDDGTRTLRTGLLSGPLAAGLQDPGLRSPSWGSGDLGLFLLRTGSRPAVLLVPSSGGLPTTEVPVDGLPVLDDDAVLRVSRDGTRVALVSRGVLQVGRFETGGRAPHIVGFRRLATGVVDVAWQSGTTLEVLVQDDEPPLLPLLELSVDGLSSTPPAGLVGVAEGDAVAIAAYQDQPLLVETRTGRESTVYSGDAAAGFQVVQRGASRPAYPR